MRGNGAGADETAGHEGGGAQRVHRICAPRTGEISPHAQRHEWKDKNPNGGGSKRSCHRQDQPNHRADRPNKAKPRQGTAIKFYRKADEDLQMDQKEEQDCAVQKQTKPNTVDQRSRWPSCLSRWGTKRISQTAVFSKSSYSQHQTNNKFDQCLFLKLLSLFLVNI